ncbi:unnamed protein product [Sphagnum troendelagicum]
MQRLYLKSGNIAMLNFATVRLYFDQTFTIMDRIELLMSENNSIMNQSDDGYELEGNWSEITQSLALDQYLQCHVKEFCYTLAGADAYIRELRAENVQLKTQFAESDIQALQNRLRWFERKYIECKNDVVTERARSKLQHMQSLLIT